jgi:hypothetical protein
MKLQMKIEVLITCYPDNEAEASRMLDHKTKVIERELELVLGQKPKVYSAWVLGPIETSGNLARYPLEDSKTNAYDTIFPRYSEWFKRGRKDSDET